MKREPLNSKSSNKLSLELLELHDSMERFSKDFNYYTLLFETLQFNKSIQLYTSGGELIDSKFIINNLIDINENMSFTLKLLKLKIKEYEQS